MDIHGLVVGDTGADAIRQSHLAGAIRGEQAGHAEYRILAERQRIEIIVIDAAIDHIHPA